MIERTEQILKWIWMIGGGGVIVMVVAIVVEDIRRWRGK